MSKKKKNGLQQLPLAGVHLFRSSRENRKGRPGVGSPVIPLSPATPSDEFAGNGTIGLNQ